MRRWNGWGDDQVEAHVPDATRRLLEGLLGPGQPPRDITFEQAAAAVPPARLPAHPLVATDRAERLRHARGQSLPDLIALRGGRGLVAPDGVARPASAAEVRELLDLAGAWDAELIPYGGGTSVVGHVNPRAGAGRPVVTVSLERMAGLQAFDAASRLATFGPGATGPQVEARLASLGHTLGHFPQSFEYSTLGGWVATRSSGQQSRGYGRIEQLFAGGTLLAPDGELRMSPVPASAAGPDLRQMVLGSEGRLGVLTEVVVRVTPRPAAEAFDAVFFPSWERGLEAARALAQSDVPLSMIRLSTPVETATNLTLAATSAGSERALRLLRTILRWRMRGADDARCMAVLGVGGAAGDVRRARRAAQAIVRRHGGAAVAGARLGERWRRGRFRAPYLRNALWEMGYAVDTVETAATWQALPATLAALEHALRGALEDEGERVHAFTHLSHLYATGASIYTTFAFRLAGDPDATLQRWQRLKDAASRAIVRAGATITHQHGVGTDHAPYLAAEKGALGMRALASLAATFDPRGIMNPGKLLPARALPDEGAP